MLGSGKSRSSGHAVTVETTSLIAHGTQVKGDVIFNGRLHIDGSIEGALRGEGDNAVLTLSDSARVKGEILAPHVVINGTVEGDVTALARLELAAGAHVEGNVFYKVMEMSAGARINGKIVHRDGPPKQLSGPDTAAAPAKG